MCDNGSTSHVTPGQMDDFRLYDRPLTLNEVNQIYGYTINRSTGNISPYSYYWNGLTTASTDNAYVTIPSTATQNIVNAINVSKQFSVSYWIKFESIANIFSILNLRKDATFTYIDIEGNSATTGSTIIRIRNGSTTTEYAITNASMNVVGQWIHYVYTFENTGTSLIIKVYKNGTLISTNITSVSGFVFTTPDLLSYGRIGNNTTLTTDPSPSYISEFRIFDIVINQ